MNRFDEILNGGMGVSLGRGRGFVAGENLCELQVFCLSVDTCARSVADRMKCVRILDTGLLLPFLKHGAHGPSRDLIFLFADKKRGILIEALSTPFFPLYKLSELHFELWWNNDLLRGRFRSRAFEGFQNNARPDMATGAQDVTHGKSRDFMLSHAGTEGHRNDHVVSETGGVLPGNLENRLLLLWAQYPRWGQNAVYIS